MQYGNTKLDEAVEKVKQQLVPYLKSKGIQFTPTNKFKCINPDHDDKTPSTSIVPGTQDTIWHCFGCQTSGNIFHAAKYLEGMASAGLPMLTITLKKLCEGMNIEQPVIELTAEEKETLELYGIYDDAARLIKCSTIDTVVPQFEERGWPSNIGYRYGIGLVESYTKFIEQLKAQGYTLEQLQKAQLAKTPDNPHTLFDSDNIIFTISDHLGTPVAFAARNAQYSETTKKVSKYINSATSKIYHKKEILYGLNIAKGAAQKKGLIIVEGYPDWITLQEKGIRNCAAVCGTALTKEHLSLLEGLGIEKIYLCLDNDNGGQEAVQRILDDVVAGNTAISVDIIQMPEGQDPDDLLKDLDSVAAMAKWNEISPISCFKWRLKKLGNSLTGEDLCKKMIPLILNEPMPITRERYAQDLADVSGIRLKAIQDQLDQMVNIDAFKKSERVNSILRTTTKDIQKSPTNAIEILTSTLTTLEDLQKTTATESLGVAESSRAFDKMLLNWKTRKGEIIGIRTYFPELDQVINGLQEGKAVGIGGKPNHGKSAFVTNLAYNVVKFNQDVIVIMHTTDDSRETFLGRMIAVDSGMLIDHVTNPSYFLSNPYGTQNWDSAKVDKYKASTKQIKEWIDAGRLIVKDSTHGTTLAYTESLIKHYKQQNPDKRILVLFDNFHKASDYAETDERIRYKRMSNYIKLLSERYHVAIAATMEYTKLEEGTKPGNSNLAESVQMEYDLAVIIHVYNQLKDIGKEKAQLKIPTSDQKDFFPIVELKVSKNKQGSFDGSLYYSFYTDKGKYEEYPRKKVMEDFFKKDNSSKFGNLAQPK